MYIHLDTIHARNLKFGIYLPCLTFHKLDFENFVFWTFYGQKCAQKWRPYLICGHKKSRKQNFRNRYIRFVVRHTRKEHTKFQVSSMCGVQMNIPFVLKINPTYFLTPRHLGQV